MSVRLTNTLSGDSPTDRKRWMRSASAVVGAVLLVAGARRRSLGDTAAAIVGGWLLYRSVGDAVERAVQTAATPDDSTTPKTATPAVDRTHTVTVDESAEELYERWRDPETQTQVFSGFASVTAPSENRQRWEIDAPLGRQMTWDAQIVEERPGELLRWESDADATVSADGSIRFRPAPGDRGTEVTLHLSFDPPGGAVGDAVADRLGIVPETLAAKTLHRFKSLVEAGEIPTLEGNPSGRGQGDIV